MKLNKYIWIALLHIMLIMPVVLSASDQKHTVRKGDTLYSLSKKYGTTVDQLLKLNNLQGSNLSIGQKLIVKKGSTSEQNKPKPALPKPAVKPISPPPVEPEQDSTLPTTAETVVSPPNLRLSEDYYYTIKLKDNLYRVAVNNGITLKELLAWNGFADSSVPIYPGNKVIIKDPAGHTPEDNPEKAVKPIPSPAPTVVQADTLVIERVYVVQKKDTLFRIATNNGMTVDELKKLNNLSSNEISVGQKIYLAGKPRPQGSSVKTEVMNDEELQKRDKIRSDLFMPVEGRVISEYGLRNGRPHKGIDLGAKSGTPIYAVLDGTVVYSGVQGSYGNVVVIEHPDFVMTVYAHNEKNLVSVNDVVKKGQQIATVGSTGNAQGSHLHFEYRLKGKAINPRKVLTF